MSNEIFVGFSGAAPRRKATDVRPRYCNQCDKQFYFQEPLDIHIKNVHKDGFQGRKNKILKMLSFLRRVYFVLKTTNLKDQFWFSCMHTKIKHWKTSIVFSAELVLPNYPGAKLTIAEQVISMKIWHEEFPQPIVDPNDNTNLVCPICRRSTKTKQRYNESWFCRRVM